jgi:hypothetical protein
MSKDCLTVRNLDTQNEYNPLGVINKTVEYSRCSGIIFVTNRDVNELIEGKHFIGVTNRDTVGNGGSLKTVRTT